MRQLVHADLIRFTLTSLDEFEGVIEAAVAAVQEDDDKDPQRER